MKSHNSIHSTFRLSFYLLLVFSTGLISSSSVLFAGNSFAKGRNVSTQILSDWSQHSGNEFHVAIHFKINEPWHIYWKNPGTTGLATEVIWGLPKGLSVSSTFESFPMLHENSGIVDYVHEGEALIVAKIQVDRQLFDPSGPTQITASVNWLECAQICVPGHSDLQLDLSDCPPMDASVLMEIKKLSQSYSSISKGVFSTNSEKLSVLVELPKADMLQLEKVYLFPEEPLNDASAKQQFSITATGILIQSQAQSAIPDSTTHAWLMTKTLDGTVDYYRIHLSQGEIPTVFVSNSETVTTGKFGYLLFLAFAGGVILNLMPCVFPVIGLKIMGFVNQAGEDQRKIVIHGLVFSTGVMVSFWILSGLLLLLRSGGQQLGWGFQLQEPWFNYALILLMFAFALSLNGVFEFGMSAIGVGNQLQQKSGMTGSFFSGVMATVVATPCSAPFLAPALGAALALQPFQAMILFTFVALGLSTPYLLLSAFPGALKILPRPGAWMETFKQCMAFPLYGTVAYLLWALLGQIDDSSQLNLLISLALFAMALWIFGKWSAPHRSALTRRITIVSTLALIIGSILLGHPRETKSFWEPWSPEAVAKYVEEGRTVYVDFTARWCATCQVNKRLVFGSEDVMNYFKDHKVVALKADWTHRDERITEKLRSLGKAAVPVNLIYKKGKDEPLILPEVLTPAIVLQALSENPE